MLQDLRSPPRHLTPSPPPTASAPEGASPTLCRFTWGTDQRPTPCFSARTERGTWLPFRSMCGGGRSPSHAIHSYFATAQLASSVADESNKSPAKLERKEQPPRPLSTAHGHPNRTGDAIHEPGVSHLGNTNEGTKVDRAGSFLGKGICHMGR